MEIFNDVWNHLYIIYWSYGMTHTGNMRRLSYFDLIISHKSSDKFDIWYFHEIHSKYHESGLTKSIYVEYGSFHTQESFLTIGGSEPINRLEKFSTLKK
jgi:hypothetical protein